MNPASRLAPVANTRPCGPRRAVRDTAARMPMEEPKKFELVVNLKTAKALGVTIPNGILLAADEDRINR